MSSKEQSCVAKEGFVLFGMRTVIFSLCCSLWNKGFSKEHGRIAAYRRTFPSLNCFITPFAYHFLSVRIPPCGRKRRKGGDCSFLSLSLSLIGYSTASYRFPPLYLLCNKKALLLPSFNFLLRINPLLLSLILR